MKKTTVSNNLKEETTKKITAKKADSLARFMNEPETEVSEKNGAEVTPENKKTVKKATRTASTKIGNIHLEIFETNVSVDAIKKAVKKAVSNKGLTGNVEIYLNAEERAIYYTVDGKGSTDYRIDLKSL